MPDIVLDIQDLKSCVRILRGFVCFPDGDTPRNPKLGQYYYRASSADLDSIDFIMWKILSLPSADLSNFINILTIAQNIA